MFAAPHIVLAGEGGYSHVLSGITLADALSECMPGVAITFLGSGRPVERHSVRERGYAYLGIPAQPPPQGPIEAIRFVAENFIGYWATRWILREQQISMVIGCGGFASGIVARAAIARGLPTILLEQNVVPSRAVRWLARSVSVVCTTFEETGSLLPTTATIRVTGAPISAGVAALADDTPAACRTTENRQRRLVVLGGNSGAASLNRAVPAALGRVRHRLQGWHVVHQTGPGQLQSVEERYQEAGIDALAVTFIDDLAHVLAETDVALCRAGGTTLAELAVAGVPAVLLPHPAATDDHQLANAQVYATAGACRFIDERACEGRLEEVLARDVEGLLSNGAARAEMAVAMRTLARPHAARDISLVASQILSIGSEFVAAAA